LRRSCTRRISAPGRVALLMAPALALAGCGSVGGTLQADPPPWAAPAHHRAGALAETPADDAAATEAAPSEALAAAPPGSYTLAAGGLPRDDARALVAQAPAKPPAKPPDDEDDDADAVDEEYDPWEPFNETMFELNRKLDRYIFKPVAIAYSKVIPPPAQTLIANGFDNIAFVPRLVNSLLQGKVRGAGREVSRFILNSTAGMGGLFDPAKDYWGIEKSNEDFGQTLGVWGSPAGPYLVLPLLPPLTIRDGIGRGVDGFMNPLAYVVPFIPTRLSMTIGEMVNDRALNLELYEGFEESVLDLYSAVRNAYLRRREQQIRE
jgi:phospholipid-binding lipoprotein MlaA